ncbi:MAG: mechanosensitive ion channel family protein [Verrucomicrobia subdivision 3 bacterium]|nr:mechanosensitive ion channel family protein [Limisphaerales bacterium]
MNDWLSRIAVLALLFTFAISPIAAPTATNTNDVATQKSESYKKALGESEWVQALEDNLGQKILGISAWQFIAAFLAILAGLVLKRIVIKFIEKKIAAFVEKTEAEWDDLLFEAIIKPVNIFVMIGAIHLAAFLLVFNLANFPTAIIGKSYTIFLGIVLIWGVYRLVDVVAHYLDELVSHKDAGLKGQFVPLIKKALRILVIVVGGLTVLATIGVNITGLAALLSVGALAFSMGAKDSVANLVGTVNILSDRPYKVGDWISVGSGIDGDVEEIGFRSTKIRMFDKTVMTVPNGTLATETIKNWSQMPKRRIKMTIGLTYDTKPDQMRDFLKRVETLLQEDEGVDQDYMLVQFTDFGPSSLDVFLYYFAATTVWKDYLETRQRVNLKIMELVEEMGLEFAYPTQTLHLKGDGLETLNDSD